MLKICHLIIAFIFPVMAFGVRYDIVLDTHIHFKPSELYPESENGPEAFLRFNRIQRGFIISPSFHIYESQNPIGFDHGWFTQLNLRTVIDRKTSDLVMVNPKRFRGLCGYNSSWNDGISIVSSCLNLPGMIGIKVHGENDGTKAFCDPNRFANLINSIQHRRPIVLWHTAQDESASDLYYFVKNYPNVNFIFAHSFYSSDLVEEFAKIESQMGKLSNMYLEVSMVYLNKLKVLDPNFVKAWRIFGMNRILFGSDLGFIEESELKNMLEIYKDSKYLSSEELEMLFKTNAEKLLGKLRHPFPNN